MAYIISVEHLTAIAGKSTPLLPGLVEWINKTCPLYDIDTASEYAHFLAQACHETDHFKTLCEYASGKAYERPFFKHFCIDLRLLANSLFRVHPEKCVKRSHEK